MKARAKVLLVGFLCSAALATPLRLDAGAAGDLPIVETTTFTLADLAATVGATSLQTGIAKSLSAKLAAAEAAYQRGNTTATVNMVRAFINEVQAQSGKFIPPTSAAQFMLVASHIIAALENGLSLGGSTVGSAGAILKVTDPNSAAYGTELIIPPNALSTSVSISMSVPDATPVVDGIAFPGSGIHLEPSGLTFSLPVTLVLPYPDLNNDGLVDGTDISADSLKVGAQDSTGYIGFLPRTVDAGVKTQTTHISHFSFYWNVVWRWQSPQTLTYRIDWPASGVATAPGFDQTSLQNAIRRAVAVWTPVWAQAGVTVEEVASGQPAHVRFAFFPTNAPFPLAGTLYPQDAISGVAAVPADGVYGFSTGGPALVLIDNGTADAVMNVWLNASPSNGLAWTPETGGSTTAISLEAVAVHALGHVTGLNDLTLDSTEPLVMAPNADLLAPETCLLPADVTIFRNLYGVSLATAFPPCPDAGMSVTPSAFDFGATPLNTSSQKLFTVTSTGTGTLVVSGVSVSGTPAFSIDASALPQSLRPGTTGTFAATFAATTPGLQQATVTLAGNAVDSPAHVALSGVGGPVDPIMTSLNPTSGGVGQPVTIHGMNFGSTQGSSTVTFRGIAAIATSWSATSIVAVVPVGAATGKVLVTVNGKSSNWLTFTVMPPPSIASVKPTGASVGQLVSISGDNFGEEQGSSTVTFNGTAATVSSWSSTTITATVPDGATTGAVVVLVLVNGRASNGVTLTVITNSGPLTITAHTSPAPNASGWHTSNVTVTFICSDTAFSVVSCPLPTIVQRDGPGIVVVGQAVDSGGNQASVTITLNVDRTVPLLTVTDPVDGAFLPSGTSGLTLRGTAADFTSGIQSTNCNGVAATVVGQSYTCQVTVGEGSNLVHVEAIDRAGFVTTTYVTFPVGEAPGPLAITITPTRMTMAGGETRKLQVVNERGQPVVGGTWTVSDPSVAEILEDANHVDVHAQAAGEATLTLTRDGLTAQATVTVLPAGTTLSSGTAIWELPGTVPKRGDVLRPMWTPDSVGEQPALFFVDEGTEWVGGQLVRRWERPTQIRATAIDGRLLWEHGFMDTTVKHVAADDHGGIVMVLDNTFQSPTNPLPQRIRRLDGVTGQVSWEFFAAYGPMSEIAIAPNGTIYVVERPYYTETTDLVALDGQSGAPTGRWSLPNGHFRRYRNGIIEVDTDLSPDVSGPIVRDDGSVVVISHRRFSESHFPLNPATPGWTRHDIQLGEVPANTLSPQLHMSNIVTGSESGEYNSLDLFRYRLLPDGQGGLLIAHKQSPSVRRVDSNLGVTPETTLLPTGFTFETEYLVGEDAGYALLHGSSGFGNWSRVVSFDPVTLTALTNAYLGPVNRPEPSHLRLRSALAGGGAFATGPTEGHVVNAAVSGGDLPAGGNASQIAPGLWAGWEHGQSLQVGSEAAMAISFWGQTRGAGSRNAAIDPRKGIFAKAHPVFEPVTGIRHIAIRIVPTNQAYWRGREPKVFNNSVDGSSDLFFGTLGAGPDPEEGNVCYNSVLKAGPNRLRDVQEPPAIPPERLPVSASPLFEDGWIAKLLERHRKYPNDLDYECIPAPFTDGYNSNSYARGLLEAAGLPLPFFADFDTWFRPDPVYPGWYKPVPKEEFYPPQP